jgi:hypothetical protein
MVDDGDCSDCSTDSTDSSNSIKWVGGIMHDYDVVFTNKKTKQIGIDLCWGVCNGKVVPKTVDLTKNDDSDHPSCPSSPLSQSLVEVIQVTPPTESVVYK